MVKIGVLKEREGDARVALVPETVAALLKANNVEAGHSSNGESESAKLRVLVETDAGLAASYGNDKYEQAGAALSDRASILKEADMLLSINRPSEEDMRLAQEALWLGVFQPLQEPEKMATWAETSKGAVFSLDMLPRTTRAQAMDVLSSQANIAGYKAVLLAANTYPRYFPMLMTAAGSIPPAKVLILGAGVAGLQAIATARRLGAVVEVFDTRPAVKEEVQSLGAKFIEVEGAEDASKAGGYAVEQSEAFKQRQQAKIAEHAAKADIVITTAQIPGKKAPVLLTSTMLEGMKAGSVIVDLAAATGGNTAWTQDGQTVQRSGITLIGHSKLFAEMPADASKLYSKNMQHFLKLFDFSTGSVRPDFEDELIQGTCMVKDGRLSHERVLALLETA